MKKMMIAAALIALTAPAFAAQDKPAAPAPTDTGKLSILEVINIGQALQQMGDFHNGRGDLVKVDFKFDGTTLLSFAINIRAANDAQKSYGEGYAKFETQELGSSAKDMKPDELAKRKTEIANSDSAKRMMERPAGALLARIKESELCMKDPPVAPCKATNNIPPALLSAILPIIDLGK